MKTSLFPAMLTKARKSDTLKPMKLIILLIISLAGLNAHAEQRQATVIGAEVWASPRQAETFLQHEGIGQLVRALLQAPEARLLLRYPDNEWGDIWGEELRSWLVSLGVSSDRIDLSNDFENLDGVEVVLDDGGIEDEATTLPLAEPVTVDMSVAPSSDAAQRDETISEPEIKVNAPPMPNITAEPKEVMSQELP